MEADLGSDKMMGMLYTCSLKVPVSLWAAVSNKLKEFVFMRHFALILLGSTVLKTD